MAISEFDTVLPADSVEFCPTPGFHDIFVCGTYHLLTDQPTTQVDEGCSKAQQKRRGQCLVFRVIHNGDDDMKNIEQLQSIDLPAIPDMKWCHRTSGTPLLAVANSEGGVTFHEWQEDSSLTQINAIQCAPTDTLCLSLDWSNRRYNESDPGSLIVSLSNGSLSLLTPSQSSSLSSPSAVQETWHAHDHEPWAVAWNYWDTNVVFSGGDDLKLKAWDIRQSFHQPNVVNKRFGAGVTSIQSHPFIEHLVAVGTYDNKVYLFDSRKLLLPITTADVGGGAWRVKWHPSEARKYDLLVACMHDGFKVVQFGVHDADEERDFSGENSILTRNDAHDSLAYGADWSYASPFMNGKSLVGCCSFYDHKLSLWSA